MDSKTQEAMEIVREVSNWHIQPYAGARYECLFCGRLEGHADDCISKRALALLTAEPEPCRDVCTCGGRISRTPEYDAAGKPYFVCDKCCALWPPKAEPEPCEDARHRIYVASSWKNEEHPGIVRLLRSAGHEVYDFRHPKEGDDGFSWSEIDPNWKNWTPEQYLKALDHSAAQRGFGLDWSAMEWADTGVLVLPCGKSAHLEAGYFVGARKRLFILMIDQDTPELMYKMATKVCTSEAELVSEVKAHAAYASQVADKRAEEDQAAHEAIASICFAAGVETPDGTSVGAVRSLAKRAEELRAQVETLREPIKQFDSWIFTFNGKWRVASLIERLEMLDSLLSIQTKIQEVLAATEPKPSKATGA